MNIRKRIVRFAAVAAIVLLASNLSAREIVVGIADICKTNDLVEVGPNYPAAVCAAGALPLVLPCTTNADVLAAALDGVDMLLLAGGEDIEPARYGDQPDPKLGKVNLRRDAWDLALVAEARRRRLPILGICRGCQMLNVAFGGTLWQDIPSQIEGANIHRLNGIEHGLHVLPGTYLESIVGATNTTVNTYHHQSVKRLAKGFKIAAMSPDGVVEAIEGVDYPALGVQFHPEMLFTKQGRKDFLPLFRGAFAKLAPREKVERRRKLVLIPDYCATNRATNAKVSMTDAIALAGFSPVVLPFTQDDGKIAAAVADADAIMVGGGMGRRQNYQKRCAFEERVLKFAFPRQMPIAGVCHGSQIINHFLGGTVEPTPQWKSKDHKGGMMHRPVPWKDNYHLTNVPEGSRLARILGETCVRINSYHSKRSLKMAKGLKVTSSSDDGVVEAFEHETLPVMAFQFHPERMTEDPRFLELIRSALSPLEPAK